jgi:hypothetical protein
MSTTTLGLLIEANIDSHTAVFELAHRRNLDGDDLAAHDRAMRSNDFIGVLHQVNQALAHNAAADSTHGQTKTLNALAQARTHYYERMGAASKAGDIAAEADHSAYRDILAAIALLGATPN